MFALIKIAMSTTVAAAAYAHIAHTIADADIYPWVVGGSEISNDAYVARME